MKKDFWKFNLTLNLTNHDQSLRTLEICKILDNCIVLKWNYKIQSWKWFKTYLMLPIEKLESITWQIQTLFDNRHKFGLHLTIGKSKIINNLMVRFGKFEDSK
jgi:hypothetical protein